MAPVNNVWFLFQCLQITSSSFKLHIPMFWSCCKVVSSFWSLSLCSSFKLTLSFTESRYPEILKLLVLVVYLNRKTQSKAVFVLTSAWIIYGLVLFLHLHKTMLPTSINNREYPSFYIMPNNFPFTWASLCLALPLKEIKNFLHFGNFYSFLLCHSNIIGQLPLTVFLLT